MQPVKFQFPIPLLIPDTGSLRTAAILSTWIVWPRLDALMPLTGSPSVRIMFITQVIHISYLRCHGDADNIISAATRIRRQKRNNPEFNHRPISRFEDDERMKTWLCPQDGCGQVQFSVLYHGDWYSNVHGMTIDGHSISGPTHL